MKTVVLSPFDPVNPYSMDLGNVIRSEGFGCVGRPLLRNPLLAWFRGEAGDCLHMHWVSRSSFRPGLRGVVRMWSFLVQMLALRVLRRPTVWTIHNLGHHEARNRGSELRFLAAMYCLVQHRIVHSRSARRRVVRACRQFWWYRVAERLGWARRAQVIPHLAFETTLNLRSQKAAAKLRYGLDPQRPCLLALGSMRDYKRLDLLVDALSRRPDLDCEVLLAGSSSREHVVGLVRRAAEQDSRIHLELKVLSEDEVALAMSAADAVVLTHDRFLTSGVAVLAATFGKPFIAPRHPFFLEYLGVNGVYFEDYTCDAVGRAIESLLKQKGDWPIWGAELTSRSAAWSSGELGPMYRQVYAKLLAIDSMAAWSAVGG